LANETRTGRPAGNSFVMRLDQSAGPSEVHELPGCVVAGRPAFAASQNAIIIPCGGTLDSATGRPIGNGTVVAFDLGTRQVSSQFVTGGSPSEVVVSGDVALVADPTGTGPLVVNIANRQVVTGSQSESTVCPTVAEIVPSQLASEPAVVSCPGTQTSSIVAVTPLGARAPDSAAVPSPYGIELALYSSAAQEYILVNRGGAPTTQFRVVSLLTGSSVLVDVVVSGGQQIMFGASAGGSVFVDVYSTGGQENLVRLRDTGSGLQAIDRLVVDPGMSRIVAVGPSDVWLTYLDKLEHVVFP
jgi:hypothetical protein